MTTYGTPARATSGSIASSSPAADVVDQRRAGVQRRPGHRRPHGVDADDPALGGERPHDRDHPGELLVLGTRGAPGRVVSPPTSSRSAPAASSARPCATPRHGRGGPPPSEKESGVTLTTPMTRVRPRSGNPRTPGGAVVVVLSGLGRGVGARRLTRCRARGAAADRSLPVSAGSIASRFTLLVVRRRTGAAPVAGLRRAAGLDSDGPPLRPEGPLRPRARSSRSSGP